VRIYNIKEEEEVVSKLVEEKKVLYLIPRQIIIYYNTVKKIEQLAIVLGCVYYY
jgi:hypothetical protein